MTTTLIDRYVWAVLRSVPNAQRADLEREVRALIADAIEARAAAEPSLDPAGLERAALTELGDPNALAARYSGRIAYLIGPGLYPTWRALVGLLLALLVPLIGVLAFAASLIEGSAIGGAIVAGIAGSFQVAIQTLFWFTLVFAIIERVPAASEPAEALREVAGTGPWTPDDLPDLPDGGRISLGELAATVATNVFLLAALLWLQLASPIVVDGASTPLFDPALWSFWLPWFIVVTVLEIGFTIAVCLRGHWTNAYAIGNALLGAAFAIPAIYLLANNLLFNPALVDAAIEATDGTGTWIQPLKVVIGVSIAAIVGWDAVEGFRKARRATGAGSAPTAA